VLFANIKTGIFRGRYRLLSALAVSCCGVAIAVVLGLCLTVAAFGGKLGGREGNPGEHLAGVFGAAGRIAAFLGGDTVVQYRHHKLGIPFQTDDRELAQSNKQSAVFAGKYQFVIKCLQDALRNLYHGAFLTAAVAHFPDLGAEDHRIQHLHH